MNDFWENKKVIVTGASGFVGSWLCKEMLERKSRVIGIVNDKDKIQALINLGIEKKILVEEADIRDYEKIKEVFAEHKAEACFHLAAKAVSNSDNSQYSDFFEVNVKGTCNVLKACHDAGTKDVLVASTTHVYGNNNSEKMMTEDSELAGRSGYSLSKIGAEAVMEFFARTKNMNVFAIRSSNIYGGNDLNFVRLIPRKITDTINKKDPLVIWNGETEIDFVYISDAMEAYLCAMEKADELKGMKINICSEKTIKVKDIAGKLIQISKQKTGIKSEGNEKETRKDRFSNRLAEKILNWQPKKELEEGLKETYDWYKEYLNK